MTKTEQNLQAAENFIREVLAKNFNQKVDPSKLKAAAVKLCEAIPELRRKAA
jgi:hypothetical protein